MDQAFSPLIKLLIVVSLLFFTERTFAQGAEDNLGIVFKIKLSASNNPLPKDHKLYVDFPELEEIHFDDGYYRYYLGNFEGYYAAKEHLDAVVKPKGYKDAYVMALRGKEQMTADKAILLIYGEE